MRRLRRLLIRIRGPLLPIDRPGERLTRCRVCGSGVVNPTDWHEQDETTWWVLLRCGACLHSREVMLTDEQARRFDRDLRPGLRAIERIVDELDRERMRREIEIFAAALDRDLVCASDFAVDRRR
jgi:hypothetical protein